MQSESKILIKKISYVKNDIQEIIRKIKNESESGDLESLNNSKQQKMEELEKLTNELDLVKKEAEYNKIKRISETHEYSRVKNKKGKETANELMDTFRNNRKLANEKYIKYTELENSYSARDSKILPGFLFFHREIVLKYGMCPYIRHLQFFEEKRKEFLEAQSDKGKLYYDLVDEIFFEKKLNIEKEQLTKIKEYFTHYHDYQFETEFIAETVFQIESLIKEYLSAVVKTKKIKDLLRQVSLKLTELDIFATMIQRWLELEYSIYIPFNPKDPKESEQSEQIVNINIQEYNLALERYSQTKNEIETSSKFIKNITSNLKTELYEYLLNEKPVILKQESNCSGKKWSELNNDTKKERLNSFAKWYISKYLINPKLINPEQEQDCTEKLITVLYAGHLDNKGILKYKHIKWNSENGIIEKINCLGWNNETQEFSLKINTNSKGIDNVVSQKRPSSKKTVISKNNDRIINESILCFLITNKKEWENNPTLSQEFKDTCIEHVREKLFCKRLSIDDRKQLITRIESFYQIILNDN